MDGQGKPGQDGGGGAGKTESVAKKTPRRLDFGRRPPPPRRRSRAEAQSPPIMRHSPAPRARSRRSMAQTGTANAKARVRKTTRANSALAAAGGKLGARGNRRDGNAAAPGPAASGNSIARAQI